MAMVGAQAAKVGVAGVTGSSGVTNAAAAADGYTPTNGTNFDDVTSAYWSGAGESITLAFDQAYYLNSVTLTADWNDVYRIYGSTDGLNFVQLGTYSGLWDQVGTNVGYGLVTLPTQALAAAGTAYSFAKIVSVYGDGANGVGELSFNGTAAMVPEPASMALMLAGVGALSGVARRRQRRGCVPSCCASGVRAVPCCGAA